MRITATEEYGMRLMLQLARRGGATVPLPDLAAAERVPVPVAAKVLLRLRRAGLVLAVRGRAGGYVLAARAEAMTVARVLRALGDRLYDAAFCHERAAHDGACARLGDCALRPVWAGVETLLVNYLERITLADLLAGERVATVAAAPGIALAGASVAPAPRHAAG